MYICIYVYNLSIYAYYLNTGNICILPCTAPQQLINQAPASGSNPSFFA